MSLKIVKTPTSIKISSFDTSITLVMKNGDLQLEQSLGGANRDIKAAMQATKELKTLITKKIDTKMNYLRRFAKVVEIFNSFENVKTFKVLKNRLENYEKPVAVAA
jgi:hypothetical protein